MWDYVYDEMKAPKTWVYGPGTVKNHSANDAIKTSGFAMEERDYNSFLGQRIANIEQYNYPGDVKGKSVIAFPKLAISFIRMRSCYEQKNQTKHPLSIIKFKSTNTRMITEVLCMLYEKTTDSEYKKMFPIILQASGFQAKVLSEQIILLAAQITHYLPGKHVIQQFVIDVSFSQKALMVGSGKPKSEHYSGIRSEIYPIQLSPMVLSDSWIGRNESAMVEFNDRFVSKTDFNKIIGIYNKSLPWAVDWDEGSEFMKNEARNY